MRRKSLAHGIDHGRTEEAADAVGQNHGEPLPLKAPGAQQATGNPDDFLVILDIGIQVRGFIRPIEDDFYAGKEAAEKTSDVQEIGPVHLFRYGGVRRLL
jgi:hypothetical protein